MSNSNTSSKMFRVTFYNQNTIYELYAKQITHDGVFGFVELSELVFGSTSELVVDPGEERLKNEFAGVKVTFIPMHSVIRIDEVEKSGIAKIREIPAAKGATGNVTHFPVPLYTPGNPSNTPSKD